MKGFKLWDPVAKKLLFSRGVTFDEGAMLKEQEYQEINDNGGVNTVKIPILVPSLLVTENGGASSSGSRDDSHEIQPMTTQLRWS